MHVQQTDHVRVIDELHDHDFPLQSKPLSFFPLVHLAALFCILLIITLGGCDHDMTRDDFDGGVFSSAHGLCDLDLA